MPDIGMTEGDFRKTVHLLYVPTLACNLSCSYCYLGGQTADCDLKLDSSRSVDTLRYALAKFITAGVLPFNVSLHGGEPTLLPKQRLEELFRIIKTHYMKYYDELNSLGFRKSSPHIKTNLYNFSELYNLFVRHKVSISGSIDLPLAMHFRHRKLKSGAEWMERTLANLKQLATYPYQKKISCTLYKEHLETPDKIVEDIRMLHYDIGLDMNNFNIMFGFVASGMNSLTAATEEQMCRLYDLLKQAFIGTELEEGFRRNWFDEFTPSYCTGSVNCGERFMLLQSSGDVWSCVRGQGVNSCYFGNVYEHSVDEIFANASRAMSDLQQSCGFDSSCSKCGYLGICHTGCPAVKMHYNGGRSYTCRLQKKIYADNPKTWPELEDSLKQREVRHHYLAQIHPELLFNDVNGNKSPMSDMPQLSSDFYQEKNSLASIIAGDKLLQELYSSDSFILEINGESYPLWSQIIKNERVLYSIGMDDHLVLHIRSSIFNSNCEELMRNTLHLQLLRDTAVIYGDEQRTKQEHIFTYQLYREQLAPSLLHEGFVAVDLTELLAMHSRLFIRNVLNNVFVTTSALRDYHYAKQKLNGFYHIQALNLPFQNFEFYWE